MNRTEETRQKMFKYWEQYSGDASVKSMMLDENAAYMEMEEAEEILTFLPDYTNLRVLELGAGIGRFTGSLALKAHSVVAVDFMQSYTDENEKKNGHLGNITFQCADATLIDYEEASFDIVFSNWLFMYLSNTELRDILERSLRWLKVGGYLLFRESCFHKSGSASFDFNPTIYRIPRDYYDMLQSVRVNHSHYENVFSRPVKTYIKFKQNPNQLCWLLRKVDTTPLEANVWTLTPKERNIKELLLTEEFSEAMKTFLEKFNFQKSQSILQLNSGCGDVAFHFTKTYGCFFLGVESDWKLTCVSMDKLNKIRDLKALFHVMKYDDLRLENNSVDVVVILNGGAQIIQSVGTLLKLKNLLRVGGQLIVSDLCSTKHSAHWINEHSGFHSIQYEDNSNVYKDILRDELSSIQQNKDRLLKEISNEEVTVLVEKLLHLQLSLDAQNVKWVTATAIRS